MTITVIKSTLSGEIKAPTSKSMTQRALIASGLCDGTSNISNPLFAEDTVNLINLLCQDINSNNFSNPLIINTNKKLFEYEFLNTFESGFLTRALTVISTINENVVSIHFNKTLKNRNLDDIVEVIKLFSVNVSIDYAKGIIQKTGKLKAGSYNLNFAGSSQVLSGLLFALPLLSNNSELYIYNLVSKPYIDMTIEVLNKFGICIENKGYKHFYIKGNQEYKATSIEIENDWSNTAFLLVAAEISGKFNITNMKLNSIQGDKIIVDIIENARIDKCIKFDATDYPDLVPALIPLCLHLEKESKITGISRLFNKESNRAEAILTEFSKINANIKLENDTFIINKSKLKFAETFSHNDHRIAMSLAIIGLSMDEGLKIHNFECVNKSYPNFMNDIKILGGNLYE